jgi:hypothetical protein
MKTNRPPLTPSIDLNVFSDFYWLKSELIKFCRQHQLGSSGSKNELADRIKIFLSKGVKTKAISQKKNKLRDSVKPITRNTLVVNYKNDAVTREFFINQIGTRFRFNSYLRQYMDKNYIKSGMTYGDLVEGWLRAESSGEIKEISTQFEYNRFIRDYFANEKSKSLADAIRAWKIIKRTPGKNTYAVYKKL